MPGVTSNASHQAPASLAEARSRIAELARLNAFISLSSETGDGPIVAVKDLIDVKGMVTTAGGRQLADVPAETDAPLIARLRKHGCVMVGKTNLHEFAYGSTSDNPHYGPVRNPHDEARIAGGSSGGSAVAAVTGMCHWAIGTDTAGSLRIPASLCGATSMKPSRGLIPDEGVVPLSRSLDVVGPMATDVSTVAVAMAMLTGQAEFSSVRAARGTLRLGAIPDSWTDGVDPETNAAWRRVSAGVQRASLPDRESMSQVCTTISMYEASDFHRDWLNHHPERYGDADVRTRLFKGLSIRESDYLAALAQRTELAAIAERAMEGLDALLAPTTAMVAPLIGGADVREPMTRFTRPFSATGQPVVTVPVRVAGLPVGMQVIGRAGDDLHLLEVALALENAWRAA